MQNHNKNRFQKAARFFEAAARNPSAAFFLLVILAFAAAAYVFFAFQPPDFSGDAAPQAGSGVFSDAQAKKYSEVFSTIEYRQKNYKTAVLTYPDVFKPFDQNAE